MNSWLKEEREEDRRVKERKTDRLNSVWKASMVSRAASELWERGPAGGLHTGALPVFEWTELKPTRNKTNSCTAFKERGKKKPLSLSEVRTRTGRRAAASPSRWRLQGCSLYAGGSITTMMSVRPRQRCHSLSDDSEEASGNNAHTGPEPEAEPEELDWDSYSTALEHRLAAVGNWCQRLIDGVKKLNL